MSFAFATKNPTQADRDELTQLLRNLGIAALHCDPSKSEAPAHARRAECVSAVQRHLWDRFPMEWALRAQQA